jgi:uncharacterized membrane protein
MNSPEITTQPTEPKRKADPTRAKIGRVLTLVGHLGLILLFVNWLTWIAPPERVPRGFVLLLAVFPLLLPLRGLLHGRRYTHQWTSFLSMLYFAVGIDLWFNPAEGAAMLGAAAALLSVLQFVGCVMYARYTPSVPAASTT